jgi:hypothetical protein
MLSPTLSNRSQVIFYHLREVRIFICGMVVYIFYRGKEPCANNMKEDRVG